jgi:L,D-transpeptidase catalytic domain
VTRRRPWTAACAALLFASCAREAPREQPDAAPPAAAAPAPDPYADFPLHGRVTSAALTVRLHAASGAPPLGWLRRGASVRLKAPLDATAAGASGCSSGFQAVHPRGYVCAAEGLRVTPEAEPPDNDFRPPDASAAMPYPEFLVRDAYVPEYHVLPSEEQQRKASDYAATYVALKKTGDAALVARFLAGPSQGGLAKPSFVRRYLEHGYFVSSAGEVLHKGQPFLRTVRGSFISAAQLDARPAPEFRGVTLDEGRALPVAWAVRGATPQVFTPLPSGRQKLVDAEGVTPYPRLSVIPEWTRWVRIDDQLVHELRGEHYLRSWYVAVAEPLPKPAEVAEDEPWVHVDLSTQTLVLYVGSSPRFATVVSTGVPGHETLPGSFRMTRKYMTDSMSDTGAEDVDDRYSIDDVPWTMYFAGSRALHGAFWHSLYGIVHSHGCINLAPSDARYVFEHTWPALPAGWHGISTQQTGEKGSLVVITE